ncbi:MAG: hypothetical protein FWH17_04860 [Oscillospiraceae bacterium]|nr:hypothetical protein [Oscillospiraceae bacterium]
MYNIQDAALLSAGMKTLCDTFGPVRAEVFIALIKQKGFDYTEWRRENLWNGMTAEEISEHAVKAIDERFNELPKSIQRDVSMAAE